MKHQNYLTAELSHDTKPTRKVESDNLQEVNNPASSKKEAEGISPRNSSPEKKPAKNNFAGRYGLDFLL